MTLVVEPEPFASHAPLLLGWAIPALLPLRLLAQIGDTGLFTTSPDVYRPALITSVFLVFIMLCRLLSTSFLHSFSVSLLELFYDHHELCPITTAAVVYLSHHVRKTFCSVYVLLHCRRLFATGSLYSTSMHFLSRRRTFFVAS